MTLFNRPPLTYFPGHKTFENVTIVGNIGNITTINGTLYNITLSPGDQDIINRQNKIDATLKKQGSNLDQFEELAKRALKKTTNQTITGSLTFIGNATARNIKTEAVNVTGLVNGVDLSMLAQEALYVDRDQTIYGSKTFIETVEIDGNMTVKGLVDGMNTSDIVTLTTNQTIYGKKTIFGDVDFSGGLNGKNAVVKGLIDNVNVSKDEILLINGSQTITGSYMFQKPVRVRGDISTKHINNVNISDLYKNAVLMDSHQIITGHIVFRNSLTVNGNLDLPFLSKLDNVDVSELPNQIMSKTREQNVTGSLYFNSNVTFCGQLTVNGYINGVKVPDDLVFLSKQQTILGNKVFGSNLTFYSNLNVDGLVNGINISGM